MPRISAFRASPRSPAASTPTHAPRPHLDAAPADRPGHAAGLQRAPAGDDRGQGATAVSLIPCNSVFRGFDCDEVHRGLLGTCGTVLNTVEDMDAALAGVPLGAHLRAMNDPSPFTLLAFMLGVAKRRGVPWTRDLRHLQPERLSVATMSPTTCSSACAAGLRGASSPTTSLSAMSTCQTGIRCRWSASTCSRPAPRRPRPWASPSPRRSSTPRIAVARGMEPDAFLPRFTFFFDISISLFEEIAKFRAGRRIWARHHARALRRARSALLALQVPRPNLRRRSHAAAAAQQHRARHRAGDRRHPRRAAVAAYRRLRRGVVDCPTEIRRAHRGEHAEHPARRGASHRRDRSAWRLLLHRVAHRRNGAEDPRRHGAGGGRRRHVRSGGAGPGAENDRRIGARFQEKIESGEQTVVGVNAYQVEEDKSGRQALPDPDPANMQRAYRRVRGVQASARRHAVRAALDRLAAAADDPRQNIFARVVEAARPAAPTARSARRCGANSDSASRWSWSEVDMAVYA